MRFDERGRSLKGRDSKRFSKEKDQRDVDNYQQKFVVSLGKGVLRAGRDDSTE